MGCSRWSFAIAFCRTPSEVCGTSLRFLWPFFFRVSATPLFWRRRGLAGGGPMDVRKGVCDGRLVEVEE